MLPYIYIINKQVPMYGLCIVTGVLLAFFLIIIQCKKEGLCWENAVIIGITGLSVGFIGAKLLYIFISFSPSEITDMLKNRDYHHIIDGGFVFYGGLIGGILGAFLGTKIAETSIDIYESHLISAIPLVHCFGRLGCLCAGCCYGKPTEAGLGVIYSNPISDAPIGVPLVPIQLYEGIYNLVIFFVLQMILKKKPESRIFLPCYLMCYACGRFVLEYFRFDYGRGIYFGISTSQFISIAILWAAVILLISRKGGQDTC